jgi:hypothetical protein
LPEPTDPRQAELEQLRRDAARAEALLQELLGRGKAVARREEQARADLATVATRLGKLDAERAALARGLEARTTAVRAVGVTVDGLRQRSARLLAELEALRKAPVAKKVLRYRTPVSRAVQTEEVMFECRAGRVTLLDTGALLELVRRDLRSHGEQLRERWQLTELTPAVGAFRLRYTVQRERTLLDGPGAGAPTQGSYRFSVTGWEAEPIQYPRGEPATAALEPGSAFRKLVDALDPKQTVVTMWVYPDSFALYRSLRDYLHDRDVVVAGRPLPDGASIASSRQGSKSRGQ